MQWNLALMEPQAPLIAAASENITSPGQISKVENWIKNRNFEINRNTPGEGYKKAVYQIW